MSDYPTVAFNLGAGYIDDAKVNEVAEKVEAMQKDVTDLNAKSLPTDDGETGMDFLARIDAYDLLTDAEGDYIADDEGKPMYGAVYNCALAIAKEAEKAANKSQTAVDKVNENLQIVSDDALYAISLADSASNNVSSALTKVNAAATKANPVFTGSFSQNRKSGTSIGTNSHAEGNQTTASGNYSHAEGYNSTATASSSHAEGGTTKATASGSHAEGSQTTASGDSSHAEGYFCTASGQGSHAEGNKTIASGNFSHAEGQYTEAKNGQHVEGMFNIVDTKLKYVHIVGNGSSDSKRSNAHTLDWDGNAWYAGSVECSSIIIYGTNSSGEDKKFMLTINNGSLDISEVVE